MSEITINLEQASYAAARSEARLLAFPDGVERLIALPRRHWRMYDALRARWVSEGDYEAECYAMALEYVPADSPHFERVLRELFALAVEAGWSVFNEGVRGNANEN